MIFAQQKKRGGKMITRADGIIEFESEEEKTEFEKREQEEEDREAQQLQSDITTYQEDPLIKEGAKVTIFTSHSAGRNKEGKKRPRGERTIILVKHRKKFYQLPEDGKKPDIMQKRIEYLMQDVFPEEVAEKYSGTGSNSWYEIFKERVKKLWQLTENIRQRGGKIPTKTGLQRTP